VIKGGNRRMFRKPGRARQAIGILASSKELMDAAQGSQMPMQPVQSFAPGGFVQSQPMSNYLFDALGVRPAGFTQVGEGDDARLQAVPGFSGAYQRLSGIADPARARQQSGMDLLELGARIAAGQSTSATENIAAGLIPTLEGIGKRRQQELANTLAIAKLQDDKRKEKQALEQTRLSRKVTAMNRMAPELSIVGVVPNPDTGKYDFTRDGKFVGSFDNYVDIPLNETERATLTEAITKSGKITDLVGTTNDLFDPAVPFGKAMTKIVLSENFDRNDTAQLESQASKGAEARGYIRIPGPNTASGTPKVRDTKYLNPKPLTTKEGTVVYELFDINGVRTFITADDAERLTNPPPQVE